jgi:hypothetical protein
MIKSYVRHSPSALNLFAASPAMFVLERVLGHKQPVGAPAHRGTAVEEGVTVGLMDPAASLEACIAAAQTKFDTVSALSGDPRRADYRETIPAMVEMALKELRPYGIPSGCQGFVEWKPEGLKLPIVGYYDYHWSDHNITVDLKTTERLPSAVKVSHARQISLYVTSNNADARACYTTPKKSTTYRIENIDAHRAALHQLALRVENFLAQSDDPQFFVSVTAPDIESFYWTAPAARQLAFEHWGV